jgi:RimJ/RimL family protein N-acetyltransferase
VRHDLHAEGVVAALRPVAVGDAAFILKLRTAPDVSQFIKTTSPDLANQERWLADYLNRGGDYYFIVTERASGFSRGTIAIYDVISRPSQAEWGRWIVPGMSVLALESALLMYGLAFEELGLDRVYCRSSADNVRVVSFHTSCGLTAIDTGQTITVRGVTHDVIEHELTRSAWPSVKARLDALVRRFAARHP